MFTYEQRIKAVKLLIKYDMKYTTVIRELGYPSRRALVNWYREFKKNGDLHKTFIKKSKYTDEEKKIAVDYYLEHGKCVSSTCKKLGYPSRPMLDEWISELAPEHKRHCLSGGANIKYSQEHKEQAVIALCSREQPARKIAKKYGVTRENLYNWKRQLLDTENVTMKKKHTISLPTAQPISTDTTKLQSEIEELQSAKDLLQQERDALEKEVYRLKLERDIYEKAAEVIKKDEGISILTLTNREKAIVINALRNQYQLKDLLIVMNMAKSSFFYQIKSMQNDKYSSLRKHIGDLFIKSRRCYGYRRIHAELKAEGLIVSEKVVRRIMSEENLVVPNVRKKKYSSYLGEITPAVDNVINRDFHADEPNEKWLTDITEFSIPAGKVYLSPIIDCFDGMPISWTIGTSPNAEMVNTMLRNAIDKINGDKKPIVHSDRGCHYRWPGWIKIMEKNGLTRSMSKKGCSPDNSACEGFFGRLKNEMFYSYDWKGFSIEEFIAEIDNYLHWYVEKRIKISLGGMSPLNYRKSLGIAV